MTLTPELRDLAEATMLLADAVRCWADDTGHDGLESDALMVRSKIQELLLASPAALPETRAHTVDCAISEAGARHGCTCGAESPASADAA